MLQLIDTLAAQTATPKLLELDVVGKRIILWTNSRDTYKFFHDTFVPRGMGGVRIVEHSSKPIWSELVDLSVPVDELNELKRHLESAQWKRRTYRPTAQTDLTSWTSEQADVFQLSPGRESAILVRVDRRWTIIGAPGAAQRREAARVVRYAASRLLEDEGYVAFHASAARIGRDGVLLVGDSGAGKSTFSLAIAKFIPDSAWLSNDRVYITTSSNGQLEMVGFPLPAALNYGSLVALGLDSAYASWSLHCEVPADTSDWRQYDGDHKLKLSPGEISQKLGVTLAADAHLTSVVYPSVVPGSLVSSIEHWCDNKQSDVLERNCLSICDNLYGEDWLGVAVSDREQIVARARLVLQMVAGIPSIMLRAGEPAHTEALVRRLPAMLSLGRAV